MNTKLPLNNKGDKFWLWIVKWWNGDTTEKVIAVMIFFGFFIFYFAIKTVFKLIGKLWISTKKQCPKCDSREIKQVKPGSMQKALPGSLFFLFGPIGLLAKQSKILNVCRGCGFSWEDR